MDQHTVTSYFVTYSRSALYVYKYVVSKKNLMKIDGTEITCFTCALMQHDFFLFEEYCTNWDYWHPDGRKA